MKRPRSSRGWSRAAPRSAERDSTPRPILRQARGAMGARMITFGESRATTTGSPDARFTPGGDRGPGARLAHAAALQGAAPGRHFAMNALAVLAAVGRWAPTAARAGAGPLAPVRGRGTREIVRSTRWTRHLAFDLIDDAYNANPPRWPPRSRCWPPPSPGRRPGRAAAASPFWATCWSWARPRPRCTPPSPICRDARIDTVHCVGPRMRALHERCPTRQTRALVEPCEAMLPGLRAARRGRRGAGQGLAVEPGEGSSLTRCANWACRRDEGRGR
jgi:UDP-N-acetylmuramoyl-tripeptide--D-alanyl-D-alanine ligase